MKGLVTRKISIALIFLLVLGVSGCGWWKDTKEWWRPSDLTKATPEGLYKRGAGQYQDGRYKKAVESFQRMKDQFPLHPLAPDAEIGIADSLFSDESYVEAEMAYKDFVGMRPTNENIPYAMYQIGMCHYKDMGEIDLDQVETTKALVEFEKLIARFPGSKFSVMAEKHVLECRRRLAEKEFYVGKFYFAQGKYKAALIRFETIVKEYPGIGLDYKVGYFIGESQKRLIKQEAEDKAQKEKEEKKARAKTKAPAATTAEKPPPPTAETKPAVETTAEAKPATAATAETTPAADKK